VSRQIGHQKGKDDEKVEDHDGWETISMDGFTIGIQTSAIEEAYEMFAMLLYPGPAV